MGERRAGAYLLLFVKNMNITAVILCGGQGTRLQPVIGPDLPKCLAPVAGRPFIEYILDQLLQQDVSRVVICGGPNNKLISDTIKTIRPFPFGHAWGSMEVLYSIEEGRLGTGGALRNALPLLNTDPVLVMNGDTYCKFPVPLSEMVSVCLEKDRDVIEMSYHWAIRMVPAGAWLIRKRWVEALPEGFSYLEDHVRATNTRLQKLSIWEVDAFHDMGIPSGYAGAEWFLRKQGVIT